MDHSKLQKRHFSALKEKYQVGEFKSIASDSLLYLILRKADLDIEITDLEFRWLEKNKLFKTVELIGLQQYKAKDKERLEIEFSQLRAKYHVPSELEFSVSSSVYSILAKLDSGYSLLDTEIELLYNHGLADTATLIQDILTFSRLTIKYQAIKQLSQLNQFPEEPLYVILRKLDAGEDLSNSEADWLLENGFEKTLEVYWRQQEEKKAEVDFLALKSNYQVGDYPDMSSSSILYTILKKLQKKQDLGDNECEWLKQENLTKLLEIDQRRKQSRLFAELKRKFKATQYKTLDPTSPLFIILVKMDGSSFKGPDNRVSEKDIQWLLQQELSETAKIAEQIYFKALKNKYKIVGEIDTEPFYEIMLKLEREERLNSKQVIQLIAEGHLSRYGKIAIAYYRLEAIFYEKEYQRTRNKWSLTSASSNWRKANESKKALKVTDDVQWDKIKDPNLKSALSVTRGAAFRDLSKLDEAEKLAQQAMEYQPNNHQPYTLMGAICYDKGQYSSGDHWFDMAIERGAKIQDVDDEIQRVVRMTKDKEQRREAAAYLFNKDSKRYSWASLYQTM